MQVNEFDKLPIQENIIKDEKSKQLIVPLSVGDYFLTPTLSEAQKGLRKKGDYVTVYKVTEVKTNGNIVYAPDYLTLEE